MANNFHTETIKITDGMATEVSNLFKVLGDKTRVKIISVLSQQELCVTDIASLLNMSHSAISHQLKVLRDARLVKYHKVGKTVLYSLVDDHVVTIYKQGLEHVIE